MANTADGPAAGGSEKAALSRELSDFLIEFSIALNKHAMYPGGHPSLEPSARHVLTRLRPLLEGKGSLSLGVARQQLVIEGVATDAKNPVLRDLAGRLHRHHLGAVSLKAGLDVAELQNLLALLSVEADRVEQPLGLGPSEQLRQWAHARLHPVTYERLEMLDEQGEEHRDEEEQQRTTRTRAAQLWIGLARAALAAEGAGDEPLTTEPAAVAQAIGEHQRGTAYDQVIVGYLLQMADELREGGGETAELRKRVSTLVSQLDGPTLSRLLEMGGDTLQRRKFLLNATDGMTVDAVIDLVRAASETDGQTISHSLIRMLQKLAHHADAGGVRREPAEKAVRDQVSELIRGWSLKDPNPDAYRRALQAMSETEGAYSVAPEAQFRPEPRRIVETALEVDCMGEVVTRALKALVEEADFTWLLERLETAEAPRVKDAAWSLLAAPEHVRYIARHEPLDVAALDAVLGRAGPGAAEPLLEVLIESNVGYTRRMLLDRITGLGPEVGRLAVQHLKDEPWYVLRNMLAILAAVPERPRGFSALEFAQHPDARVRREALNILMSEPATRERGMATALADDDERNVRLGLTAALDSCPETTLPMVIAKIGDEELHGETRVLAIRVLGASAHPRGLETLLRVAAPRRRWFRWKLPSKSEEYIAALRALQGFPDDARARNALSAAAGSKDPDIVRAAMGEGK